VSKLIEGTLADDDVQAIEDEFVSGDALSRAVEKAEQQFDDNDFNATRTTIESALSTLEQDHVYEDDELVEWRCFDNYVDRVLYNRLLWDQEHETRLAPRAYLEALLISSSLALGADDLDRAQNQAKRALSLSPLNTAAHIQLIKCLSAGEHYEEVVKEINRMLELGHDPTTLGYGYYFMALAQWMRDDTRAAFACYERATSFLPPRLVNLSAGIRPYLTTLTLGNNITVPDREISSTLVSRGIVDAPTYMMTDTFLGCTRAALDAELFPVAREFLSTLDMMTHDDVYFGMLRSLESEPDR
jgi:tetratricopeptide (TPR) repeat protein